MECLRKMFWDPSEQIVEEEKPLPQSAPPPPSISEPVPEPVQTAALVRSKITRNRTGNGHKKEKVRDLEDPERNFFKNTFLSKNGQLEADACTVLKQGVAPEVAIFQITGFISYLHREVAQNRLELNNLQAYCSWMHERYQDLWEQWNRPAFVNVRRANAENRAAGRPLQRVSTQQEPTVFIASKKPELKPFAKRGVFHRAGT